ncbi:hypothetical protein BGX27_008653 [Mortierella sp. AM989]|nr:hypothetical protein BGX27_008653 [Mortierella sp. AM989]
MSSEFAEFLFSFACNKLESPQLDLRQQLLHSNLIRHILLVHQQSTIATGLSSSSPSSPSPSSPTSTTPPSPIPSEDQPQLLCLPPLPPSPPLSPVPQSRQQSHQYVFASPSTVYSHPNNDYQTFSQQFSEAAILGQTHSNWSPFSYDDELDRIGNRQSLDGNHFEDLDVDMEEDPSDPTLYLSHNDNNYDSNLCFGFHPYFAEPQHQMEGNGQEYDFESSQAQEDWLDAVLEDLMEEDEQEDSSPEYDSDDDDNDSFREKELEIGVTRGPTTQAVVVVAHKMDSEEDAILGCLLDQSGQQIQNHHHYQQQQPHHTLSSPVPCSSLLHPYQSIDIYTSSHESSHPYHKSYLHQSFPAKEKGSTAIISTTTSTPVTTTQATPIASVATSSPRPLLTKGVLMDEPMLRQDHVSQIKQRQQQLQNPSYFKDDAYYHSCPPCLGFHSSSRPYSQRGQSEDALREQRFVQLTQELGAALVQEQEVDPNPNLLLPEQQTFEDSFLFRSSVISPAGGQTGFIALDH